MRDIGKNIRALRMRKNMTQDELAEKLFVTRQTVSNYETGRSRPDVEMLLSIAAALDTDANTVLYGPPVTEEHKRRVRQFCIGAAIALALAIPLALLWKPAMDMAYSRYIMAPRVLLRQFFLPLLFLVIGWTVMCGVGLLLKAKPLENRAAGYGRWAVFGFLALWLALMLPHMIWFVRITILQLSMDGLHVDHGTESSFLARPQWLNETAIWVWQAVNKRQSVFLLFGVLLWVFGFPKRKPDGKREKLWFCAVAGLCLGLALYAAAEKEYVLTLEPGANVENLPARVEIRWRQDENETD